MVCLFIYLCVCVLAGSYKNERHPPRKKKIIKKEKCPWRRFFLSEDLPTCYFILLSCLYGLTGLGRSPSLSINQNFVMVIVFGINKTYIIEHESVLSHLDYKLCYRYMCIELHFSFKTLLQKRDRVQMAREGDDTTDKDI